MYFDNISPKETLWLKKKLDCLVLECNAHIGLHNIESIAEIFNVLISVYFLHANNLFRENNVEEKIDFISKSAISLKNMLANIIDETCVGLISLETKDKSSRTTQ
jgi:hypothetical protein